MMEQDSFAKEGYSLLTIDFLRCSLLAARYSQIEHTINRSTIF